MARRIKSLLADNGFGRASCTCDCQATRNPFNFPDMNAALAAEIQRLSPAEKLLLVEELWNQIAKESNAAEPPPWHDQALAEDAARYSADPARGDSWADVKRRITSQA